MKFSLTFNLDEETTKGLYFLFVAHHGDTRPMTKKEFISYCKDQVSMFGEDKDSVLGPNALMDMEHEASFDYSKLEKWKLI